MLRTVRYGGKSQEKSAIISNKKRTGRMRKRNYSVAVEEENGETQRSMLQRSGQLKERWKEEEGFRTL